MAHVITLIIHEPFCHSYWSWRSQVTPSSRRGRASVRGAGGDMVGKLEHAWKELRTGGRGLGGGTGLAGSSSSSRFPLLRNEGRKTMEKRGVHTVWLHAQTCRRTGAQTANAPRRTFSENQRGPDVGRGWHWERAAISGKSFLVFQFTKGEGAFLKCWLRH